jgi:hypothetical protein
MKIIRVDNFNRDHISDTLVATGVSNYYAEVITEMLNRILGGIHSSAFYRAVEDDHKLYEFAP